MCDSAEKEIADQAEFQVAMTQEVCDREKQQEKSRDQPSLDIQQIWKTTII